MMISGLVAWDCASLSLITEGGEGSLKLILFLAVFLNKEFFSSANNLSLKDFIFEEVLFESTELLLLDDAVES